MCIFILIMQFSDVMQPCYDDNAGALGKFDNLEKYFKSLKCNGPARGYYPDPTKIILSVHQKNLKARELFGRCRRFKVYTGARYLGGYIGND